MAVDSLAEHSRRLRIREFIRITRERWLASALGALMGLLLGLATNGVPF